MASGKYEVFFDPSRGLNSGAQRVMYVIDKLSLTMLEACKQFGVSRSYLYSLRAGEKQPTRKFLKKVAEHGKVDLYWLETGIQSKPEEDSITVARAVAFLAKQLNVSVDEMMVRISRPTNSNAQCSECAKRTGKKTQVNL